MIPEVESDFGHFLEFSWFQFGTDSNKKSITTHRKWKETKLQPGTAGLGNMLGCCLLSFHFLWAILCPQAVLYRNSRCCLEDSVLRWLPVYPVTLYEAPPCQGPWIAYTLFRNFMQPKHATTQHLNWLFMKPGAFILHNIFWPEIYKMTVTK